MQFNLPRYGKFFTYLLYFWDRYLQIINFDFLRKLIFIFFLDRYLLVIYLANFFLFFLIIFQQFNIQLEAVQLETGEHLLKIKYDTFNSGEKKLFKFSKVKTNFMYKLIQKQIILYA